jgi:hypothetical protein
VDISQTSPHRPASNTCPSSPKSSAFLFGQETIAWPALDRTTAWLRLYLIRDKSINFCFFN